MITLVRTNLFDDWLRGLKDIRGKARIIARLRSASLGNLGDCAVVGDGVSEMRIHFGPGYRIYLMRTGETIYLLLAGGDKSTQKRDIVTVRQMAQEVRGSRHGR